MAKTTPDTDTTIESLLEQRSRYEEWLARLDSTGDKAPPAVRAKVRSDYEGRLRGVIDQLRGHAATIHEELERHQGTQGGLDQERRLAEEALAEAEVRYAVGEYAEAEWQRISEEHTDRLSRVRQELRSVGEEIARLAEVQSLIGSAPRRTEPPVAAKAAAAPPAPVAARPEPEPTPPAPVPEPMFEPDPEPVVPVAAAPKPTAKPVRKEPEVTHGAPPADELAFLKSVGEEERKPAPAPVASGRRVSNPGPSAARVSDAAATSSQTAAAGKGGATGVAKTLKCGECGTLNRPTEWYCERCGAELAGI
jgi:outer membrane biosynthesis protein TonB